MARTYKKNAQNVFKIPIYAVLWFWLLIALMFAVVLTLLLFALFNTTILLVSLVAWLVVVILIIVKACSVVKRMIKAGTIETYFIETSSEKAITKSLLATMSVNRLQDTPEVDLLT